MEVALNPSPFPHVLINDFYTSDECVNIWHELKLLSKLLLPSEQTQSAFDTDKEGNKVFRKKNLGVFLSQVYKHPFASTIMCANRKLFDKNFMKACKEFNFIFGYLPETNKEDALVQFYGDGQYYKPHKDESVFSATVNFHSNPKEYTGGVLRFVEYDYSVDLKHNQCILFPSFVEHEVTTVSLNTNDLMKSRITFTTFIGFN